MWREITKPASLLDFRIGLSPKPNERFVVGLHVAIDRLRGVLFVGRKMLFGVVRLGRHVATLFVHRDQPLDHLRSLALQSGTSLLVVRQGSRTDLAIPRQP
jgi:hypothetical protein